MKTTSILKPYLLSPHDLSVIQRLTQRVIVLKDGEVVDDFKIEDLFDKSRHPYSQLLINSMEYSKSLLQRV